MAFAEAPSILLKGNGAREHAIGWKLKNDNPDAELFFSPGNGGTALLGENLSEQDIGTTDHQTVNFAQRNAIDLVVVGPETFLVRGLIDKLEARGTNAFGPLENAAIIEGSKIWSGEFNQRHNIPSPKGRPAYSVEGILRAINEFGLPIALKGDGLAGGKAVEIAHDENEAAEIAEEMILKKKYGDANTSLWVQEFARGKELSIMAFTDGIRIAPMPPSRDYKKAFNGDRGPNTGGMGAICYPGLITKDQELQIMEEILQPAIKGLADEGRPFRGVIYSGLMLTTEGPKVLEWNGRFGDPEVQVTLPRLKSNLWKIMMDVIHGRLDPESVEWSEDAVIGVSLVSNGYPDEKRYKTGFEIIGLDSLPANTIFFHGGTVRGQDNKVTTSGGRVGTAVSIRKDPVHAWESAYDLAEAIDFDNKDYRDDIGKEEIDNLRIAE